ncbi:MAG: HAD family phosphatase [Clostridiaceae bacterium]|nr:HAD family phosphatase [Clostridiaceae bacterium]
MRYKLIVLDMDGTLLNSKHEISPKNKKILKEAMNQEVKIAIATGRIFASAKFYAKLVGIKAPIIACNGALIKDYEKEEVIYSNAMKKEDVIAIVELCKKHDLYFKFYDENTFYVEELNSSSLQYQKWNLQQSKEDKINIVELGDAIDYLQNNDVDILKMSIINEDTEKLQDIRKYIEKISTIEINKSWYNNIEIMNKGVSKGKAIEGLRKILQVDEEEIIAFGDNYNDLSMKDYVGAFVSMENGEAYVREKANYITKSNDEDGVAEGIIKYVLS